MIWSEWKKPLQTLVKCLSLLMNKFCPMQTVKRQVQNLDTINTSYLTDSYIVFTLKMESLSKIKIFVLKMMVKSGLEKIFLKFLQALTMSFLLLNLYF